VHGRWLVVEGQARGTVHSGDGPSSRRTARNLAARYLAIGIASSGQHAFDFRAGEIRLSVLRASAYCHERGFDLDPSAGTRTSGPCPSGWKFADIGVHEFRLLVTAGVPASVKAMMPGLADHLAAPPATYAHLPYDADRAPAVEPLLSTKPSSVRLLACKLSLDGDALVVRLQEAVGKKTKAELKVRAAAAGRGPHGRANPEVHVPLEFAPFEIKTLRVGKDARWQAVRMIEEV
jgi:alpha-mannosidase